jgi:hypothetical protein
MGQFRPHLFSHALTLLDVKNIHGGAFSLWLMVKDDGTAMGVNMKSAPKSR